jgi:hypothetical protein
MNIATIGGAVFGFFKKIPEWVIWVVVAIVTLKFVDMRAERRGRGEEKKRAEAETVEVINTIEKEGRADADAAIEARDNAPQPDIAERVPDEVADRIFKD